MLGVQPSFATGFAQSPGESEYPQSWEGIVGAWDASLGMTGNVVKDLSMKGRQGTFHGTSVLWTPGKFGSAISMAGNDERIDIANIWASTGKPQSIAFWVKPNNTDTDQYFWTTQNSVAGVGGVTIGTFPGNGAISFYSRTDSTGVSHRSDNGAFTSGAWHLIVVTWTGSLTATEALIYVNGVEVSGYQTTTNGVGNFITADGIHTLGGRLEDDARNVNAVFSSLSWYNRVLTASEIALLHHLRKQVA